jgi:hypothetical protein
MSSKPKAQRKDRAQKKVKQETKNISHPRTREELKQFVHDNLDIRVPDQPICPGHRSPMDYLWHTWRTDDPVHRPAGQISGDCIVWANRGGGKTQLAAIATLLDGLFKDGCRIRIVAGSLDQAGRMYEYLAQFIADHFESQIEGRLGREKCRFQNGAEVRVLSQSQRAVRGQHVQKLRCDEVELFQEEIFNAAKFCARSEGSILGSMECLSTMHQPWGLMQKIISQAGTALIPIYKWCLWEVIEKCPPDRHCSRCPLSGDCQQKARRADGFMRIDDCIAILRRSSRVGFETEMLCLRPNMEHAVFRDFDPAVHVHSVEFDEDLPLYRTIDFGYVNPFVCLWIQVDHDGVVRVIDEHVQAGQIISGHGDLIKQRTPGGEQRVAATYCDPAGSQRHGESGKSPTDLLKEAGIRTYWMKSDIQVGLELIRRALRAGDGSRRLVVSSRCVKLIEAMQCYRYPQGVQGDRAEVPVKDGVYDHPIDALRYFFANYYRPSGKVTVFRS